MHLRLAAGLFLAGWLSLSGCGRAVPEAQQAVASVAVPAVVQAREAVEAVVPAVPVRLRPPIPREAVDLIVAFEIGSRAQYDRSLRWPIWPGGQSGVTWCIGYDGGHQTRASIARDWRVHQHVDRLVGTSGVIGPGARALAGTMRDVLTEFPYCEGVFLAVTLPAYCAMAERAFRNGWHMLTPYAQGALCSLVYNRGASMHGSTRAEMRVIRDVCTPEADHDCIARNIRGMTRLWIGTPIEAGMRRRRYAEADLVLHGLKDSP